MRAFRVFVPAAVLIVLCLSCKTSGDVEPIVIDFSVHKTPTPTPGIVPAPTEPPPSPTPAPVTSPTPRPAEIPSVVATPERVAENYEAAYNRHDLEAIASLLSADAQIFEPPDRRRDSGLDSIRRGLASHFSANPGASRRTSERFTQGNFVVERLTESAAAGTPASEVVISEIRDGKIVRMWILR
jgi:hypothetical protein